MRGRGVGRSRQRLEVEFAELYEKPLKSLIADASHPALVDQGSPQTPRPGGSGRACRPPRAAATRQPTSRVQVSTAVAAAAASLELADAAGRHRPPRQLGPASCARLPQVPWRYPRCKVPPRAMRLTADTELLVCRGRGLWLLVPCVAVLARVVTFAPASFAPRPRRPLGPAPPRVSDCVGEVWARAWAPRWRRNVRPRLGRSADTTCWCGLYGRCSDSDVVLSSVVYRPII